ncbi:MAG: metal ABC transporter substrate-binding protein, partial [Clostridiales bacterium]|nr:metal ABC transporter substrate-binding protein [Clostridiales bacterium]
LVDAGQIHYEPFGIYPGTKKSLDEIADGDSIAIPNDTTNEARALLLLAQEGIIKLKDDAGINATVEDIVENPLNIQFKELAPEQLVAALPDVDVAVINGNYAIEGGLHVSEALAVEANDGLAAQTYGNIIATSPEKANDPAVKALVEVLQGPEVAKFIEDTYDGAVVPLFG